MIGVKDIEKLAELARIKISEGEKESLVHEIDSILAYVAQIKDAGKIADAGNALPAVRNVFRDDHNPHESGKYTEAIIKETPRHHGEYVKVKKIIEQD
jgi:aspartyl-tRNA(Asn)/glutamyl-tRNA(Gln) amidotransferase subunit C